MENDETDHHPLPTAKQNWTPYLVFCNASIILGSSLAYGYNLSVINAPFSVMNQYVNESFIRKGENLSEDELSIQWSIVVTLYLIGGFIGSVWFPGALVTAFGKKNALLLNSLIGAVGAVISFITPFTGSYIPFMLGRVIVGFQCGLAMIIAPDLIAEQAPARLRGGCGSLFTIGVPLGINTSNLLGMNFILGRPDLWHYLFLILLAFYVIHAISLLFVVESPVYLLAKEREKDAVFTMKKLRNATEDEVRPELDETRRLLEIDRNIKAVSFLDVFKRRQLWWPMIIVLQMGIVGEVTGLAPTFFYATKVLEDGGLDSDYSALVNFVLSLLASLAVAVNVALVDRFGRRLFMILPLAMVCCANAMQIVALTFKIYQLGMFGFALFLFFFGVGPGILPLYMTAEMFPQPARPIAYAVGMFTTWSASIFISFVFPIMQLKLEQYSFLPFVVISFIEGFFFLFFLPETSFRLVDYDPDRFAPGRSLLQLKYPPRKNNDRNNDNNNEELLTTMPMIDNSNSL